MSSSFFGGFLTSAPNSDWLKCQIIQFDPLILPSNEHRFEKFMIFAYIMSIVVGPTFIV